MYISIRCINKFHGGRWQFQLRLTLMLYSEYENLENLPRAFTDHRTSYWVQDVCRERPAASWMRWSIFCNLFPHSGQAFDRCCSHDYRCRAIGEGANSRPGLIIGNHLPSTEGAEEFGWYYASQPIGFGLNA